MHAGQTQAGPRAPKTGEASKITHLRPTRALKGPPPVFGVVRCYSKGGLMGLLGPLILRLEVQGGGTRVEAWPHGVKICRGGLDAERGL